LHFIEHYKAAIITALLAGIVVLGMFSIQLKQQNKLITESYYELQPEPDVVEEELQKSEDLSSPSSNKAFNEDQEYKDMMRNFKAVDANDFERTTKALEAIKTAEIEEPQQEETCSFKSYTNGNAYALNSEETKSYKRLQEELKKRLDNKKQADEHAKTKSTLTYSLKGRTLAYYKTPRYLCEYGGKIVVTIKVNASGNVYDAYINGASNSKNPCLTQHAIEYAKSVQFDASERTDQLGTITFLFKGKR
jgi:TonB family protein